jgi:hypothetical protein
MLPSRAKSQHSASSVSKSFVVRAFSRDKDQKSSKSRASRIKAVKNVTLHPDIDSRPERISYDEAEQLKVSAPAVSSKSQDDTDELARDAGGNYGHDDLLLALFYLRPFRKRYLRAFFGFSRLEKAVIVEMHGCTFRKRYLLS